MQQQVDLTQLPVAPTLHWMEAFGLHLWNTPSQKRQRRSELSMEAYLRDVRLMSEWFEGRYGVAFSPEQLNQVNLKEYFQALENAAKPATYNRRLASVRMLISWARSVDLLDEDPAAWIPFLDAVEASPHDVSDEERVKLEEAAEQIEAESVLGMRDALLFFLMDDGGLRISEAIGLRVSDVDLERGKLRVKGKGRKYREVHIATRLTTKIASWLDRGPASIDGTLITDEYGRSIRREQAWKRFQLICERAGVWTNPHSLRHAFVLGIIAAYMQGDPSMMGAAIQTACQQTGDTVEVILAYYTNPRESDIRAAMERMR